MSEITSIPRDEQETTISFMRDDDAVSIYTSNRTHLDRLRKLAATKDYVNEIRGASTWAEFTVRSAEFHLFSAIRAKRAVSEAQRAAAAERFAAYRAGEAS